MIRKSWQRWTILAFLLSVSLYSLDRVWSQTKQPTSEERIKRDIYFLASEECAGRLPVTKGIDLAADYIAKQYKEAGLKPAGKDGSYFQPVPLGTTVKLEDKTIVTLQGPDNKEIELTLGKDYQILGNSASGKVTAPLVFAGYGISDNDLKFDEYKDLDVAGKIIVLIRRTPRLADKGKPFNQNHASLDNKFVLAEKMKAAGIILINDTAVKGDALPTLTQSAAKARAAKLPAANIKRAAIEPVLQSALKKSLSDIEQEIDKDLKPQSAALKGWSATIECKVVRAIRECKNTIGVLEGAGPLADETVVIGAHHDHLGLGAFGSRAPGSNKIHYGADDNGSGTAGVMELARRFSAMKNRQGRRLVFMTYTAEESGLIGSAYYCNNPIFPLDKTVAMVNMDMIGRLRGDKDNKGGKLTVFGVGTGKNLEHLVEKYNEEAGFALDKRPEGNGPSDHTSFFRKSLPVYFFFTGLHAEYHTPKDTADTINIAGMKRVLDMIEKVTGELASDPKRPEFVDVKGFGNPQGKAPNGAPRLSITPQYDYTGKDGVKVVSVHPDGVAAEAGLKAGDLISEVAGQPIRGFQDYTRVMAAQKVGSTIDIVVMRDKKNVAVKATLK